MVHTSILVSSLVSNVTAHHGNIASTDGSTYSQCQLSQQVVDDLTETPFLDYF